MNSPQLRLNKVGKDEPRNRFVTNPKQLIELWERFPEIESQEWLNTDWISVNKNVKLIRCKIYEVKQKIIDAEKMGDLDNVKKYTENLRNIQKRLVYQPDNLRLDVRRVTQINKGRNTPGLDMFFIKTVEDRPRLYWIIRNHAKINQWEQSTVKRVYIPKKNGKLRPLGIPTIVNRVIQALVKSALEPEWECRADIGSYGFRPGRCCADAIEKIHPTLTTKDHSIPKNTGYWMLISQVALTILVTPTCSNK